ncbi:MAG: phytoene/squalene synthase family protein [Candidatus Nanopelagicaceae bacterium]
MDELSAAGITNPTLRKSYSECKRLNSLHGKTYYLATLLLPKAKRPFVHSLYGFARYADEIVDAMDSNRSSTSRRNELEQWSWRMLQDINRGESDDQIGMALVDTVKRFDIPIAYFEAFLHSMAMDLEVTEYANYESLMEYVYGSAAVIGLQMLPILGFDSAYKEESKSAAENLGIAFQLANFIRDIGEDLDRGRVYLPQDELQAFGVDSNMLEQRKVTDELRKAIEFQIERVRLLQSKASDGIKYLEKSSQPCIEAASELYCGIVDEVEEINYQVFEKRAKTSTIRRLKVALPAWARAVAAR